MPAPHQFPDDSAPTELWCVVDDDAASTPFTIPLLGNINTLGMKTLIKREKSKAFEHVDTSDLTLWKLNVAEHVDPDDTLLHRIRQRGKDLTKFATKMSAAEKVLLHFSQSPVDHLHILVQVPKTVQDQRASKRARLDYDQPPQTPPSGEMQAVPNQNKGSPPRLQIHETEAAMVKAFGPFKEAIQHLATGKLDGYLDSTRDEKEFMEGVSTSPILLVHDLGKYAERERIKKLFVCDTTHLFNTSGAGKTRLSLDGLCQYWGIYISCLGARKGLASGSQDFSAATKLLLSMSTWNLDKDAGALQKNAQAADRVFAMLLCARIFVLKQFVDLLPPGTDLVTARRRWVLLQAMPTCLRLPRKSFASDIFVTVLEGLRHADTPFMLNIARAMLDDCYADNELFPDESTFFVVIDEAQVAADHLKDFFPSTTGTDLRPALHELYRFFDRSGLFDGIIIAGTGLSIEMVKGSVRSHSAKNMGQSQITRVFTDTGCWSDKYSQEDYVRRYLELSDTDSDRRLMDRIKYWFSGRYRVTASLVELLLHSEDVPRHRVLTAFAKHLTGFTILDATDLESKEGPISEELMTKIEGYGHLIQADRLFREPDRENLIQCLVNVLMRWRIGSQATSIPIENSMHMLIWLGVGHLNIRTGDKFVADSNFPVYINEPLVVLSLSSIFEKCPWTTRIQWIRNSLSTARNRSSLGFISEELLLLVLLEEFGGKFTALGKVFHFPVPSPLASRKVTLVSLKRNAYGTMQSCGVSWQTGCSDRFGFKAENPTDILRFLQDPGGKPFLFPDNHMGPDLICFLQDQETMELVVVALQSKISTHIDAETWIRAVNSVTPEFFYTIVKDGQRGQYAPVSYPGLLNEVDAFWKTMLGPGVYQDVANVYRRKLRSSTRANEDAASLPQRKTPQFLCILASPDDEQQHRLQGSTGITAILRWKVMEEYFGSMADVLKMKPVPVQ